MSGISIVGLNRSWEVLVISCSQRNKDRMEERIYINIREGLYTDNNFIKILLVTCTPKK